MISVLGEGAEPRDQKKEKRERLGTKLRPGIVLLQQHKLGWISKTSNQKNRGWWTARPFRV